MLGQAQFERLVTRLHALGPRVIAELLSELGAAHLIMTSIEARLERYAALDPAVLAAIGADRMPPRPIRVIQGGKR